MIRVLRFNLPVFMILTIGLANLNAQKNPQFTSMAFINDGRVKEVEMDDKLGTTSCIYFRPDAGYKMSNAEQLIRNYFKLNGPDYQLAGIKSVVFNSGIQVDEYKLVYKNILLEHSSFIIGGKKDKIISIMAESYVLPDSFSARPLVAKETALLLALQYANPRRYSSNYPEAELVIARDVFGSNAARLAWKFDVKTENPTSPNGGVSRSLVYIDAHDSRIILSDPVKELNDDEYAGLVYANESGAVKEGLKNIWTALGKANLAKPDTYGGVNWNKHGCAATHINNICPVATNAAVMKKWFTLLVNGPEDDGYADLGLIPNAGNNYGKPGPSGSGEFMALGMDAAKSITRLTELLLTPNASFMQARLASIQAARIIYGEGSQAEKTVTDAWYAVNVGEPFTR